MSEYWSCSKFADKVRGVAKPHSASMDEWKEWNYQAEKNHPIRYWIAEELLDRIQKLFQFPGDALHTVQYYMVNRFFRKTHALTASKKHIGRGDWNDLSGRLLYCVFDSMQDYVECELAAANIRFESDELRKEFGAPSWPYFRRATWRSRKSGLAYLDWSMNLTHDYLEETDPDYNKPTRQAETAKELKEIYLWWVDVYPHRRDPHDLSGWSEFCTAYGHNIFSDKRSPEEQERGRQILDKLVSIEDQYYEEEQEMLRRLIAIRSSLWT